MAMHCLSLREAEGQLALHHRDPFDRMLLAQAKTEGLHLVSADEKIQHYRDQVEVFWPGLAKARH